MAMELHQLSSETSESVPYKKTPNPSLHPTAYSGLRPLPSRVNSNVGPRVSRRETTSLGRAATHSADCLLRLAARHTRMASMSTRRIDWAVA
jgi:hypothetical protein